MEHRPVRFSAEATGVGPGGGRFPGDLLLLRDRVIAPKNRFPKDRRSSRAAAGCPEGLLSVCSTTWGIPRPVEVDSFFLKGIVTIWWKSSTKD